MPQSPFGINVTPDWQAFLRVIRREGEPRRVHFIELFLDREVQQAICDRFGVTETLDPGDPYFAERKYIALQAFLGYDYVRVGIEGVEMPMKHISIADTAGLPHEGGRSYMEEHKGPITSWEDYKRYPWPDAEKASTRLLEWFSENVPESMCIVASGGFAHFAEHLTWLFGYESLCFALYEQRDLVKAISDRLIEMYRIVLRKMLAFERVKIIWGSDDLGFKTGPMISPADLREFVLPGHRLMAEMSHAAGRPYLLHACGNHARIMDDLLNDVKIDALHSFEDTIVDVREMKRRYGDRIALLGGIDVDFLCRADEQQIRARVRDTLQQCMPGGGYCLGSGNSVANYIPVDNYLAMLDEGRRFKS